MILAGDIGGTKTNLGLFDAAGSALTLRRQHSFPSKRYPGLEAIVDEFLTGSHDPIVASCFGIAGPVIEARSVTPNLPWLVDAAALAANLKLDSVALLNDLEATAHGIGELKPEEFVTLNEGKPRPGNAALIAAGTGLGTASLFWDGKKHVPSASEGGHMDFSPRNELEIQLLRFMFEQYKHVSFERLLSGPALFRIYEFLRSTGFAPELPQIAERFKEKDPSAVVSLAAQAGECPMCIKALDMFAEIYGASAGNLALLLKATAGVFIGGGIAPKIIGKLKDGTFMRAFIDKGRLSPLLEKIPVRVIMNDKTALLGAARVAANQAYSRHSA